MQKQYSAMEKAAEKFLIQGKVTQVIPYGNGHINDTYKITTEEAGQIREYILQKMNTTVFPKPQELMENIVHVTQYLGAQIEKKGGCRDRETMNFLPTADGSYFYKDGEDYYRLCLFIRDGICLEKAEKNADFRESGRAFGQFQAMLRDYPAETLHAVIPDFHNTKKRFQNFLAAVEQDRAGRVSQVQKEIAFVKKREEKCSLLVDALEAGKLPLRVTHNDTKLNNVMMDKDTGKGLCVIDLDTVMPGLAAYDFGDSIRFGANRAEEDETDLSKVGVDLELYEAYAAGFLEGCENSLGEEEIRSLPLGAQLMTLECGMRFLTDYLQGDVYFKIHREQHNLDRCRCQFALLEDMERNEEIMLDILEKR